MTNSIPTLRILIGISGSGKSTYTIDQVYYSSFEHVSTDSIREELFGDPAVQDNGRLVFEKAFQRVFNNLLNHQNTIFDATNKTLKDRRQLINYIKKEQENLGNYFDFDIEYIVFNVPLEECIRRATCRPLNPISEDIVRRQYDKLVLPTKEEIAENKIKKVEYICS